MSDITDRIADVIHASFAGSHNAIRGGRVPTWAQDAAEAVVEELGLRVEEGADFTFGGRTRYVTEWVDDV
jgi:hypothetical protein